MNIASPFIRRPVMTTLVMLALLFFGALAYRQLPVSDLPTVDYPVITVSASLPGTSPETMASAVATPLEKQFSTIAGVTQMTSSSSLGQTSIVLQFDLSRDIDAAAQDVNAAIAQTLRILPSGITPPSYQKVNPAAAPILYFALTSDQLPISAVDEYAETFLGQRLSMVSGVAQVTVFGSQKYAVRIQLDPDALAQRGLGIGEVASAVRSHNVDQPTGTLWGPDRTYTLQASGQLANAAQFRQVIVAYRNGAPVRLGELGNVLDDVQNNKAAAWFDGARGVILAIQRQPGTNTVAVARAVRATMVQLAPQLPSTVQLHTMYDRSLSINATVSDVKFTLVLTLALVVLVIFLFLRNVSATVIPSLVLPLAVVGTFAGMYALGFSLDNLSLMALTLAVGFVVDDAVVMLENIVRHLEMGKERMTAATDGAREVGFTIISMTLSLIAVFIPLLFMPGVVGRLFHEFAVTISLAILISGVVSLSLTPMLSSRVLRVGSGNAHGRVFRALERAFELSRGAYERSLRWAMVHRPLALAFSAAVLIGTVVLFSVVPKGFIPTEDTGQILGNTLARQGASFDAMVQYHEQIMRVLASDSNVAGYMTAIGMGGNRTTNQGIVLITLKPIGKRLPADRVIQELGPRLAAIPGITVALQVPPAIQMGGQQTSSPYQFQLQSANTDTLYAAAQRLATRMAQLTGVQNVVSDLQLAGPQVSIQIDRDRADAMGVAPDVIETALYDAYGSGQVSTIYTANNQYWVVMELEPRFQQDLGALNRLYVSSNTGTLVPLSSVAVLTSSVGPLSVNHAGQVPAVTISFNTAPGVALSQAEAQIQTLARQVLPSGVTTAFAGNAQAFQGAVTGMLFLVVIAIFVIYLVLGILYESFVHPATILTGLPFAMFGGLLALWVFRLPLDVYGFVAIILLLGIVKKNAIMMIDFAIAAEREGKSAADAIIEAASVRFRPIMMTTFAALMAALPIALGTGAGSESRRPLGVAVAGGLAFSQLVTLYATPVFYTYFDEFPRWVRESWRRWAPRVLALCVVLCIATPAAAQQPERGLAPALLFESHDPLRLVLTADFNALNKDRGARRREHAGVLSFVGPYGDSVALDVRLRTRGQFRLQRWVCAFPMLEILFDEQQAKHTVFAGQSSLQLTDHCQDRDSYEQNLIEEYLLYPVFNLISERSFRARLVRVTYLDRSGKAKPVTRYAFFVEDDGRMAQRTGTRILEQRGVSQVDTDVEQMGLVAMFEYLIGNTDWSVAGLHNIVLTADNAGTVFALPYDFDWSGLISAPYAVPDSQLGIQSVRQRLYQGSCRTPEELAPTIARFNEQRNAIYALFRGQVGLAPNRSAQALGYFDEFYRTINDPRAVYRAFMRSCVRP